MSSTHSSRLSDSYPAGYAAVRKLVAERVGRQWCLFIDRDGVINRQVIGDYVRDWQDFEWLPRAPLALKGLREWAPYMVVVTNQQGIGKGLMRVDDVELIHRNVRVELATYGVLMDAVRVCPHLESAGCACRKPRPGLILDWLEQHPDIDHSLSVMVGDSESDLQLAQHVAAQTDGCASVLIGDLNTQAVPDASFESLWDFAVAVERAREEQRQ